MAVELATSRPKGWVSHNGGPCPVVGSALVEVEFRGIGKSQVREAETFNWSHNLTNMDIVAYHVVAEPLPTLDVPPTAEIDANELAAETLQSLGWHFEGTAWVMDESTPIAASSAVSSHPLYPVFVAAIEQAMYGKGERHGGAVTPFTEQPWVHYVKMHGRGFATGQSAKKLEEAASLRSGKAFEDEMLGAMVYAGMAVLKERGEV